MKLSQSERETLIGPAAVGIVLGVLCGVITVALNSEYRTVDSSAWSTMSDAVLSFIAGLSVGFIPLGLLPVLIGRVASCVRNKRL